MSEYKYTIFCGVNGAGKTTLFRILSKSEDFGTRVNVDEIVEKEGANWRDKIVQLFAGKKALRMIGDCISKGESFHQETTVPNATILKLIKKARDKGYKIQLYFVGVENIQTAIKRVNKRVKKGGHGVEEELIRQRFDTLPKALGDVLPLVDSAFFYDNTVKFIQVAYAENNVLVDCDIDLPVWFWDLIAKAKNNNKK